MWCVVILYLLHCILYLGSLTGQLQLTLVFGMRKRHWYKVAQELLYYFQYKGCPVCPAAGFCDCSMFSPNFLKLSRFAFQIAPLHAPGGLLKSLSNLQSGSLNIHFKLGFTMMQALGFRKSYPKFFTCVFLASRGSAPAVPSALQTALLQCQSCKLPLQSIQIFA